MEGHAVHDRCHRKFSDAVVHVIPRGILRGYAAGAAPQGEVGAGQIGRASEKLR